MLSLFFFSCSPSNDVIDTNSDTQPIQSCEDGTSYTYVMNHVSYARRDEGVAWGLNVDDHVSDDNDEEGCFKEDLVDPLGNKGIDNALSALLPALDMTEAAAVEGLMLDSINNGELLLMLQITGIESETQTESLQDDCVTLEFLHGEGTPLVGTDGAIIDGQSFSRDPYPSVFQSMAIEDGAFLAKGMELHLEMQVLDKYLIFDMNNGGIYGQIQEDGTLKGYFGGGVALNTLYEIAGFDEVQITDLLNNLLSTAADLAPDENGECQQMSVAFEYTAIPAHLFVDEQ
jgi:hypothetical protein